VGVGSTICAHCCCLIVWEGIGAERGGMSGCRQCQNNELGGKVAGRVPCVQCISMSDCHIR
jgi:hypothetical protein